MRFLYQDKLTANSVFYRFFLKKEVGSVSFTKGTTSWSIQYQVRPEFRGQGIGLEMVKQALEMFSREEGRTVEATVIPSNEASISLLKRLGFEVEESTDQYIAFKKSLS